MSNNRPPCALNLSRETLSAWRDQQLPDAEARRIAQHVPDCAACQARLGQFARIAAALQQQATPDLRAQTWRGLQSRLHQEQSSLRHPRAALGGLGAVALLALIALVAVFIFNQRPHGTSPTTPAASATSVPAPTNTPAPTSTTAPTNTPAPFATFAVTAVDLMVSPNSIAGKVCGSQITFTYTATFHIPANTAGGTIQFMYSTNNGRGSTPATLSVAAGATTAKYAFTSSGMLTADRTFPSAAEVMVTSPSAVHSPQVSVTGSCA